MTVKLFEGAWGVTRAREVVGPIRHIPASLWAYQTIEGHWHEHGRVYNSVRDERDIIAVFAAEPEARAWVERKPLWKRLKTALRKAWHISCHREIQERVAPLRTLLLVIAAFIAVIFLFACASPTSPASTCKYQGLDGKWYECGSDTVRAGGLGTHNNAHGARGGVR